MATGEVARYAGSSLVFCEKFNTEHEFAALPSLLKCAIGGKEVWPTFKTLLDTKTSPLLVRAIPVRLEKIAELGIKVEKESEFVVKPTKGARKTRLLALSTTSGSPVYFCVIALGASGLELTDEAVANAVVVVVVGNATFARAVLLLALNLKTPPPTLSVT